jgi:hypothetical protein
MTDIFLLLRYWLHERLGLPLPKKERDLLHTMASDPVIYEAAALVRKRCDTLGYKFLVMVVDTDGNTSAQYTQFFPVKYVTRMLS